METLTRTRPRQRTVPSSSAAAGAAALPNPADELRLVVAAAREAVERALSRDSEEFVRNGAQRGGE